MPKKPEPWWREDRQAWFVQINRKRFNLGKNKKQAWQRYYELMARPQKQVVACDSLLAVIDSFLDWCLKHRAAETYVWYRYRLERFARRNPDLRASDLRPFHVQKWIDEMDVARGTKRNFGRAVKRCLRWAKKQGYIESNPITDLELPSGDKREQVVSSEEWNTILENVADESFRDLLVTTWEIGCRPQESLRVEGRHVDLMHQRWMFPPSESKTKVPRIVYLTDAAFEITKRLFQRNPIGPLFRNSRGKPWTTDSVNCAFVRLQIKMGRRTIDCRDGQPTTDKRRKYAEYSETEIAEFTRTLERRKQSGQLKTAAELLHEARKKPTYHKATRLATKYSLYALRHTWMNRLLKRGVDSLTVAFLAGHSDPSTLAKFYAHLSQDPEYLLAQVRKAAS